jgi:hypothetical protein
LLRLLLQYSIRVCKTLPFTGLLAIWLTGWVGMLS